MINVYLSKMEANELAYDFLGSFECDSYPQLLAHPTLAGLKQEGLYKFTGYDSNSQQAINIVPTSSITVTDIFITDVKHIPAPSHAIPRHTAHATTSTATPSGEYGAIAAGVTAAIAAAAGVAVATTAMVVAGYIIATIIVIGISLLLGQVMKMLSPSQKAKTSDTLDAAIAQKNLLFNGIQNSVNQGCGVPLIFGECFFGGVIISKRLSTIEAVVTLPVSTVLTPYEWTNLV